jgi:hypothetical protein
MKHPLHHQPSLQQEKWPWPLPLEEYDKEPTLREWEYAELEKRLQHPMDISQARQERSLGALCVP